MVGETEAEREEMTTQGHTATEKQEGDLHSVLPDSKDHALTTTQHHLRGTIANEEQWGMEDWRPWI